MFPEKIVFDGEKYGTNSYNKFLEWIFQNTNELEEEKPEDRGEESLSSGFVPLTGQFYELFINDLDLIWRINPNG
jgi:hypothetical protein